MNEFSIKLRQNYILQAQNIDFDLIIIGGGITGCGIALDATIRGLKTLLIEKTDYAAGTSSKSTKLIHGGLRYLKQLEFGLVRETGLERAAVHKIAPHLVHPEKMLLPIVEGGTFNKYSASLAISVYDFLANVEKHDRKKSYNKEETLHLEPLLNMDLIKGGIVYSEYRTDDARLTIELIKKAVSLGCISFNYCEVIDLIYYENKIVGVSCIDKISNQNVSFKSTEIVSAAGPWVDTIREMDESKKGKTLHLTKGVHIVINKNKFPINQAVYFDAFDGRMIFAIPRGNTTYIGTSDTNYYGNKDHVVCDRSDIEYLLKATNKMFPTVKLNQEDVISSWAGLRPLIHQDGKSPSDLSRKDEIFISDTGLISIAGGKLTGYRQMAKRVVTLVLKRMNKSKVICTTRKTALTDNPFRNYNEVKEYTKLLATKIEYQLAWYLVTVYGRNADFILKHANGIKDDNFPFRLKLLIAEANYCIHREGATNPVDFFNRRTGIIYFDIELVKLFKSEIIDFFIRELSYNENKKVEFKNQVNKMISDVTEFGLNL